MRCAHAALRCVLAEYARVANAIESKRRSKVRGEVQRQSAELKRRCESQSRTAGEAQMRSETRKAETQKPSAREKRNCEALRQSADLEHQGRVEAKCRGNCRREAKQRVETVEALRSGAAPGLSAQAQRTGQRRENASGTEAQRKL